MEPDRSPGARRKWRKTSFSKSSWWCWNVTQMPTRLTGQAGASGRCKCALTKVRIQVYSWPPATWRNIRHSSKMLSSIRGLTAHCSQPRNMWVQEPGNGRLQPVLSKPACRTECSVILRQLVLRSCNDWSWNKHSDRPCGLAAGISARRRIHKLKVEIQVSSNNHGKKMLFADEHILLWTPTDNFPESFRERRGRCAPFSSWTVDLLKIIRLNGVCRNDNHNGLGPGNTSRRMQPFGIVSYRSPIQPVLVAATYSFGQSRKPSLQEFKYLFADIRKNNRRRQWQKVKSRVI